MNYKRIMSDNSEQERYMKLVSSIKNKPVPEDLKESIWRELKQKLESGSGNKQSRNKRSLYYSLTGIAAAIAVLMLLFRPGTIETDYYSKAEKQGKGPVGTEVYNKGQDPRVDRILDYCNGLKAEISALEYTDDSHMLSSITIKMSRDDYRVFREIYNANNKAALLPESVSRLIPGMLRVQIYFPGRKYFTGDLNGDGYDDIGSCFYRDRKRSEFFFLLNDTAGEFLEPVLFNLANKKLVSRKDDILCGDINGDGYDDMLIRSNMAQKDETLFRAYINDKDLHFVQANYNFPGITYSPLQQTFFADINGDRFEDIIVYNTRGKMAGRFMLSLNNGSTGFADPVEFKTGLTIPDSTIKHKAVVMDINGDGLSDCGIYWQMGEKDAQWYFSLTGTKLKSDPEFRARFGKGYMAFQGDYLVYTGDINNDGYDELLVKAGTTDEISFWYHMRNEKDGSFSSAGSLKFDGEEDIIVKSS